MNIPKLQHPIVLVHGLFGFDSIRVGTFTLANYFAGVPQGLRNAGNRVLIPKLSFTDSVAVRASQLKSFLDLHVPDEPVHILAHSMGGLDSRYMISKLGMEDRVLSLTTLGTPHRGCSFADWCIARLQCYLDPILLTFGVPTQGFHDLTIKSCAEFNQNVIDSPKVHYFSVAGRHRGQLTRPEWYLPYSIVMKNEGPNDGVVSQESAKYGEAFDVWEGDHLSLVNWFYPLALHRGSFREPIERYAPLIRRLVDIR